MTALTPRKPRDRTRAAIIETAMDLFESSGFENVTVDDIAAKLGISRRTIFRHFETKADIVFQPIMVGFRTLPESLCAQPGDRPIGKAIANSLNALVEALEERRDEIARHLRVVMRSEQLRLLSRSLNDAAMLDLRNEIAVRIGEKDGSSTRSLIWTEMLFSVAFLTRDGWLLRPEEPIAPAISEGLAHVRDFLRHVSFDPAAFDRA